MSRNSAHNSGLMTTMTRVTQWCLRSGGPREKHTTGLNRLVMDGLNLWRYIRTPILRGHFHVMHMFPHVRTGQVLGEEASGIFRSIHLPHLEPFLRYSSLEPQVASFQAPQFTKACTVYDATCCTAVAEKGYRRMEPDVSTSTGTPTLGLHLLTRRSIPPRRSTTL